MGGEEETRHSPPRGRARPFAVDLPRSSISVDLTCCAVPGSTRLTDDLYDLYDLYDLFPLHDVDISAQIILDL